MYTKDFFSPAARYYNCIYLAYTIRLLYDMINKNERKPRTTSTPKNTQNLGLGNF
jgi:hypothetical protein